MLYQLCSMYNYSIVSTFNVKCYSIINVYIYIYIYIYIFDVSVSYGIYIIYIYIP